ncbi:hypothetical protein BJX96DRAFT_102575 [Aspergillus floccosus]
MGLPWSPIYLYNMNGQRQLESRASLLIHFGIQNYARGRKGGHRILFSSHYLDCVYSPFRTPARRLLSIAKRGNVKRQHNKVGAQKWESGPKITESKGTKHLCHQFAAAHIPQEDPWATCEAMRCIVSMKLPDFTVVECSIASNSRIPTSLVGQICKENRQVSHGPPYIPGRWT